jgi:aspartate/methionine/tyrosine aminotransferase
LNKLRHPRAAPHFVFALDNIMMHFLRIPAALGWAQLYSPTSLKPLLNVSQGTPSSGPFPVLKAALSRASASDEGNSYGEILGVPALKEQLVNEMKIVYGTGTEIDITPDDVGITAGCNLAFYASVVALADPGDELILPCPWYAQWI